MEKQCTKIGNSTQSDQLRKIFSFNLKSFLQQNFAIFAFA